MVRDKNGYTKNYGLLTTIVLLKERKNLKSDEWKSAHARVCVLFRTESVSIFPIKECENLTFWEECFVGFAGLIVMSVDNPLSRRHCMLCIFCVVFNVTLDSLGIDKDLQLPLRLQRNEMTFLRILVATREKREGDCPFLYTSFGKAIRRRSLEEVLWETSGVILHYHQ